MKRDVHTNIYNVWAFFLLKLGKIILYSGRKGKKVQIMYFVVVSNRKRFMNDV
ncbi:hypothetical protein HNR36_001278 [Ureibacillus thermosphaericus]|uniref:Uncharacterized protein n=1 Tax=Ureibacillus thermosphaericus TaxID=51173 RepID=A0A840PW00_URETH|nr:hypothetical protein [Ureibacillus thermosphaericus]